MATCELTVTNRPFGLTARLTRSEASRRGRAARRPDRAVAGPSAFGCALPEGGAARTSTRSETLSGGHSEEATPVLIPNTAVKLLSPDGTALATAWESRTLPDSTLGATRREPVSPLFLGDHIEQWRKIRFGRLRSSSIEPFSGLSGPAGPQRPQDRPCSRARTQCAPGPSVPPPDRLPPARRCGGPVGPRRTTILRAHRYQRDGSWRSGTSMPGTPPASPAGADATQAPGVRSSRSLIDGASEHPGFGTAPYRPGTRDSRAMGVDKEDSKAGAHPHCLRYDHRWRVVETVRLRSVCELRAEMPGVREDLTRPTQVESREGFRIWLRYSDGTSGEIDLSDLSGRGVFSAWTDRRFFESVRIGPCGAVSWGEDLDLCPDAMYLRLTGKSASEVFGRGDALAENA